MNSKIKKYKLRYSFVLFFSFIVSFGILDSNAQIINTIAGNGIIGFSGDGGQSTAAQFHAPQGIHMDNYGNLNICDASNERIRKINSSGIIYTIAGTGIAGYSGDGGQASAAKLWGPNDITVDGAGNIFIADANNYRIRKIDPSGIITTIAGTGTIGLGGDGGDATAAQLNFPTSICVDGAGNILFADQNNHKVRKINTLGVITTVAGTGVAGFGGDGSPATAGLLNFPQGIDVDAIGNIYISDGGNRRIRKIDMTGIITTIAGTGASGFSGDGGMATGAAIGPAQILLDGTGSLFIADFNNSRLREINSFGIISTIAGISPPGFSGDGGTATSAQLNGPVGIAVGCGGNIYFSDRNNQRIRRIAVASHVPAFAGGHTGNLVVCANSSTNNIDTLLTASDSDTGQAETWSAVTLPMHGTLISSYSAIVTGGTLMPSGLSYTPAAGYSGTDTFTVQVSDCMNLSDTTTVFVRISDCTLGIVADTKGSSLNIYPNPATGVLTIKMNDGTFTSLTISNSVGQVVISQQLINATQTKADVNTLPAGSYYITVKGAYGSVVRRFVKD